MPLVTHFCVRLGLAPSSCFEQAATDHGVNIRILSPSNKKILSFAKRYEKAIFQYQNQIKVRHLKENLQTRISLLLVDKKYSLTVGLNDDTNDRTIDAIGIQYPFQ